MEFKQITITTDSNIKFSAKMPTICPHCGKTIEPDLLKTINYEYKKEQVIAVSTYIANCCNKHFFAFYDISYSFISSFNKTPGSSELLYTYPNSKPTKLPESIEQISPRFVQLYNASYMAEQIGNIELAATGYRNALELLTKDYAIDFLEMDEAQVSKLPLCKAISETLPTIQMKMCADVIRVIGNDYTHFVQKHPEVDFNILTKFLKSFIYLIDMDYCIKHPPVPTQYSSES